MATKTKIFTKYVEVYVFDNGTELEEQRSGFKPVGGKGTEEYLRKRFSFFTHRHCRERIFYCGDDTLVVKNEDFEPQNCRYSGKSWNFTLSHEEYEKLKAEGYNWE